MVLSGKPPDYKQRGNRNETNSSVAMEMAGKLFLKKNPTSEWNTFNLNCLLLLLIFLYVFFYNSFEPLRAGTATHPISL